MRVVVPLVLLENNFNPYAPQLYESIRHTGVTVIPDRGWMTTFTRADIWHFHWPERGFRARSSARSFLRAVYFFARMLIAKARGARMVWTVHNVRPHESRASRVEKWSTSLFLRFLDGTIHPSSSSQTAALNVYPYLRRLPAFVIPLGHARDRYVAPSRVTARAEMGVSADEPLLVYFGLIRTYKNVPRLVECFRQLHDEHARLVVLGRPHSPELEQQVRSAAHGDPRVRLRLEYVSSQELAGALAAADLVVLPFQYVDNSSSVLLALAFGIPVLSRRVGALEEVQQVVGSDWLRLYEGELSAAALREAVQWSRSVRRAGGPDLARYEWDGIATATAAAYAAIAAR